MYFLVCKNQGKRIQIFIEARQVIHNEVVWVYRKELMETVVT